MELAAAMAADAGQTAADLAAFERLVREHERRVYRTSLHLLGNHADAEDAAQEVFLRLHRNLRRMDAERDLAPWIYRVTVNVCRDLARRRPRTEELVEAPSGGASAEEEAGRAEQVRLVKRALRSLPEKQRAAVVLRDMEGLTTAEVSHVLGASEAANQSVYREMDKEARMSCARWEERLALWVEGDLPQREAGEVERHLAGCAGCREFRAGLERSQLAVKALRAQPVDAEVLDAFRGRVMARAADEPPRRSFVWWPVVVPALAAGLAAAILWPREEPAAPPRVAAAIPPAPVPPRIYWTRPLPPRRARTVAASQLVLMRIETDDPKVVIYWIVEGEKGE